MLGVSSFSWRQVAVDTITGAATAGAGAYLKSSGGVFTNAAGDLSAAGRATQAVAGYAGTVVGNTIVGRDAHFSWNAVAQTAVGAYVSAKIGGELPITQGGSPGKNITTNSGVESNWRQYPF